MKISKMNPGTLSYHLRHAAKGNNLRSEHSRRLSAALKATAPAAKYRIPNDVMAILANIPN